MDEENKLNEQQEETSQEDEVQNKEQQTREENRKFAALRRQHEEDVKKVKYETLTKATDENVFKELGIDSISDEYSEKLVNFYKEGQKKEVENPQTYAYKKANEWKKEEENKQKSLKEEEDKNKEKIAEEVKSVKSKYKKDLETILKEEPLYEKYFGNFVDSKKHNLLNTLDTYYSLKDAIIAEYKAKLEQDKQKEMAKKQGDFLKGEPSKFEDKPYTSLSKEERISYLRSKGLID